MSTKKALLAVSLIE